MAWNTFLALVPWLLSCWLFRRRRRPQSRLFWWLGVAAFIAFLPNAPYVLTDIIHLIRQMGDGHSLQAIILILLPQYLIFMLIGWAAYTLSLLNLEVYLNQRREPRWIPWSEWVLHGLCAFGVYLGRFLRFNSWDILVQPLTLFRVTFDRGLHWQPWVIIIITSGILSGLYWVTKPLALAWLRRGGLPWSAGHVR
jgi:uncharacterized membrane protein